MKKIFFLVITLFLATVPMLSQAQDSTKVKARNIQNRKAMREKWQNATPEQKEKFKEKAKEMKSKYDSLPPKQEEALRERLQNRRNASQKP